MEKESIAIVGLACRYPGANTVNEFWDNLINGYDAIQAPPPSRHKHWLNDIRGGFVSDIDAFDAEFFGISANDAVLMDPQHRILLETTWHALEDAGYDPRRILGTDVSVFVGTAGNEYEQLVIQNDKNPRLESHLGIHPAAIAGRLSHQFGLCGKSITINTACSSSLVAIELACQDLCFNQSTLAICAGVNSIFSPHISERLNNSNWLSRQGICKSFDSDADGYVRSEGVGVAVLKLYSQAKADGDRIYAVVRDCCVRHNGRGNGLALPSMPAQVDILSKIYLNSDINPDSIFYIEASAVGAKVGDVIELKALGSVIGKQRSVGNPLRVGSIKPNIGNSEAASGMAGFIKVALSIFHKRLVPTIHYKSTSPVISLDKLGLRVQTSLEDLSGSDLIMRAGVSSFGFSGTNAHILLEEIPREKRPEPSCCPLQLIILSAKTITSLKKLSDNFYDFLTKSPGSAYANISFTANLKRCHFEHRLAIVASSKEQLIRNLSEYLSAGSNQYITQYNAVRPSRPPQYGFEFTGKCRFSRHAFNYAYAGYEQFRSSLTSCEQIIKSHFNLDLADAVDAESAVATIDDNLRNLLAEYIVYQLLLSWGLNPYLCTGAGLGVYSAACCAGIITIDDVIQLMINGNGIKHQIVTKPSKRVFYSSCSHIILRPGDIADASLWEKVTKSASSIHSVGSNTPESEALLSLHIGTGKVNNSDNINNKYDNYKHNISRGNESGDSGGSASALSIESLLFSLISLSREGVDINLDLVCRYKNCQILSLPAYPFEKQRFLVGETVEHLSSDTPIFKGVDRDLLELLPPSTELQRQLHALWSEVLGHTDFGITDNFFLVGGNSLAAAHLAAGIQKAMGFTATMAQIFLHSTIKQQSDWLHQIDNHDATHYSENRKYVETEKNLVILQPLGQLSPLFLIHGMTGGIGHYIELARAFAPRRPVFGLQSDDQSDPSQISKTVKAIAEKYADQIMQVQSEGVIHLLGYSAGGWYAHAVAAALVNRGATIGMFAILDSDAIARVHRRVGMKILAIRLLTGVRLQLLPFMMNPSDQPLRRMIRMLKDIFNQLELLLNLSLMRRPLIRLFRPELAASGYGYVHSNHQNIRLLKCSYRPKRLPIAVDLFTPEPNVRTLAPLWRFYCQAGITVHPMFETHEDFYKKPELVPILAAALEEALQRAESAAEAAAVRPGFTSR